MTDTLPWGISEEIDSTKYRLPGETFREKCNRIASALADNPTVFHTFRDLLLEQKFLPGGRIQAAAGTSRATTYFNCFLSGTIADSFVDGPGSIMQRATEAAQTMRMGGGIGYDFSPIRPRGALIAKLDSKASGPVSFMGIFDAICKTVASSGHRRGAQMGVLRVDHPDIEEFIHAKNNSTHLTGFNISVGVTDEFMRAVENDAPFDLKFEGRVYKTIQARALWEQLMRSTWYFGEPGVIFLDRLNAENNLYYCESLAATNPCAELPLPPHGACLLGSFNLTQYSRPGHFDLAALAKDVWVIVRCLDRVVDISLYPIPEQRDEAMSKRRMGIGITGLANAAAISRGYQYGSDAFCAFASNIMEVIRNHAYKASSNLACERGSFPLFDKDAYLAGAFVSRLPGRIRDYIANCGVRNSHLIAIAPTGTISLTAGNVSSGIEPVWQLEYQRVIGDFDGQRVETVKDYAWGEFGKQNGLATEISPQAHLKVMAAVQPFVDSAVSKTVNVPNDLEWESFKDVYMSAYKMGLKSCATFTHNGKREGIFKSKDCRSGECEI